MSKPSCIGLWIVAAAALAACASPTMDHPRPSPEFYRALALVLQQNLPEVLSRLAALPDASLAEPERRARACIQARFGPEQAQPDDGRLPAPVPQALAAYRRYWSTALLRSGETAQAETQLRDELRGLLAMPEADMNALGEALPALARRSGLHAVGGVTSPLHEFMLWRSQREDRQTVPLPGGPIDVRVTLLDDFVSFGWAAWGTCDRSRSAGWATAEEGIMVVAPAWDLRSEEYRVSLLGHEAQHFSDYARYPKLASTDLEYRAKLVELVMARDTQRALLVRFADQAHRDRSLPHPFASHWVGERLRDRLGGDPAARSVAEVSDAARALLAEHGAALDARGAATVETALPD